MADTNPPGTSGTNATAPTAVALFPNRTGRKSGPKRAPGSTPPSGPATYSAEHLAEFLLSLEADLPSSATSYLVTIGSGDKRMVQPIAPNVGMVDLSDGQEVVALLCTHALSSEVLRGVRGYCDRVLSSRGELARTSSALNAKSSAASPEREAAGAVDHGDAQNRNGIGFSAAAEIEQLCDVLCRDLQAVSELEMDPPFVAYAAQVRRLKTLNGVVLSVLGDDCGRETKDMAATVWGSAEVAA